jgi:electron transport complex protein RnfC
MSVEITADGSNNEIRFEPIKDWREQQSKVIIKRISDCGIVGMGGAGFPAQVKLSPPPDKKIDTLIINAAECEPYLTTDHRLMLERTDKLLLGTKILQKILNVSDVFIAIENNKHDAIDIIRRKIYSNKELEDINVTVLEAKYPQGGEKQLVSAVVNREIPSGKLTMDSGCVVQNVASTVSICNAVLYGIPLTERVITVSGSLVKKPGNYLVPIGANIQEILQYCGADLSNAKKVIMGGPMMGVALSDTCVPVMKQTSGLLVLDKLTCAESENNCINCGNCVKACPVRLIPSVLAKYSAKNMFEEAQKQNVTDCMECGCCSYVCPARINILHRIRACKNFIVRQKAAKPSTQDNR